MRRQRAGAGAPTIAPRHVLAALLAAGVTAGLGGPAEARSVNGLIAYSKETSNCDLIACEAHVWTRRPDGTGRRRLPCSADECTDLHPIWSPRGAFLATGTDGITDGLADGAPREVIAIRDVRGRILRRIPVTNRPVLDLAWSGDGERLAYNSYGKIYIVRRDGTNSRLYRRTGGVSVAWSRTGRMAWSNRNGTLVVTDRSRKRVRRLGFGATRPRWSPDSRWLAYKATRRGEIVVEVSRANGAGRRSLTRRCDDDEGSVAWSPDGRQILCSTLEGRLLAVGVRSGRVRIVARGVFARQFDWRRAPNR